MKSAFYVAGAAIVVLNFGSPDIASAATITASSSNAAIINTPTGQNSDAGGDGTLPLTLNLARTSTITKSSGFTYDANFTASDLADGALGNYSTGTTLGYGPSTVTIKLPVATLGYNISNIQVYSSYPQPGGEDQSYTLSYSLAADPLHTQFVLGSFEGTYVNDLSYFGGTLETSLTSAVSGAPLATGVDALYFSLSNSAYSEIQIFGTPSLPAVPEPSTWVMLLLGMGAMAIGIRRRQLAA